MIQLREVELPPKIPGKMFLHSMPGRYEPIEEFIEAVRLHQIHAVISLAGQTELAQKSPDYAHIVENNTADWKQILYPIPDFGVPVDRQQFFEFVDNHADDLRHGKRLLVHCGAGIGRTGMMAVCLLILLSEPKVTALDRVKNLGSHPETQDQIELIEWVASQINPS